MTFSTDRDLLVFEPRLFAEFAWPGQVLARGSDGELDGTSFVSDSADFTAAGVAAGMVLCISGPAGSLVGGPASLEIVSMESGTELIVSALRRDGQADAIPATLAGEGLTWHVASFAAQAEAVALEMLTHFGLSPADPACPWGGQDIASAETLRPLSACGVLATVLAGAAHRTDGQDGYWTKAAHYRGLFDRGLAKVRLGLDSSGDGSADVVRHMGSPRLRRD